MLSVVMVNRGGVLITLGTTDKLRDDHNFLSNFGCKITR